MDKDFQGFAFVLFEPNRPAAPLCCNRKYITLFSALDFVIKKLRSKKAKKHSERRKGAPTYPTRHFISSENTRQR